jgi:heme/copper-type cytochrome/quinol oxidase subunit 2
LILKYTIVFAGHCIVWNQLLLQIDDETRRQTLFIDSGVGFVIIFVVIVVVIVVIVVVVVRRCRFQRDRTFANFLTKKHIDGCDNNNGQMLT